MCHGTDDPSPIYIIQGLLIPITTEMQINLHCMLIKSVKSTERALRSSANLSS